MKTPSRMRSFVIVGAIVVIALAVVLFTPSTAPAEPVISWTPESITQTVPAGQSATVPVSFTASEDLTNVVVHVVPELILYIQTNPTSFTSIAQGQTVQLDVIISAPASVLPHTFDGTIQLRSGVGAPKTLAKPLPVMVEIWKSIAEKGIVLGYPSEWQLNPDPLALSGPISLNNFAGAYQQGGIVPEGGATIDITTVPLPSFPVSDVIIKDLQEANIESTLARFVGGEVGTEVIYTVMFTESFTEKNVVVYVPHNKLLYKFFLSYRAADLSEEQFLTDFQRILDTVHFAQ